MHLSHALILTLLLYVVMRFVLQQSHTMALNRSLLVGVLAFIYMIFFGHKLPFRMGKM